MEKRTPRCRLAVVKDLVAAGGVRTTVSALAGGAAPGVRFRRDRWRRRGAYAKGLLQEYDHARRSPRLAGRLPAIDAGRRGVFEAYGPGRRADRVVQRAMKKGAML